MALCDRNHFKCMKKRANPLQRIPAILWNAAFTPHGRKNVANRYKLQIAKRSRQWRKGEPMPYRLKDGTQFVVHRGNTLSELIYTEGAYEPLETTILRSVLQQEDVVFDIGANVGYFTTIAAGIVGTDGCVHSFEPGPGTFVSLEETICTLGLTNVTANNVAVSDHSGTIEFLTSLCGGDAQQSILAAGGVKENARAVKVQAITVDSYLDSLEPNQRTKLKLVKCDVEGAEVLVLDGAKALLRSTDAPIWLIEHNRAALAEQGFTSENLCDRFPGYQIFFIPLSWPPSVCAVSKAQTLRQPALLPDECNLVAVPSSGKRSVWLERLVKENRIEDPH